MTCPFRRRGEPAGARSGHCRRAVNAVLTGVLASLVLVASPNPAAASPRWKIQPMPSVGKGDNVIYDVRCNGQKPTTCVAVGWSVDPSGKNRTLAEFWDGHKWAVEPSPNISTDNNGFDDMTCASATFCEGVGSYVDSSVPYLHTLVENWNGSTWTIQPSANHDPYASILTGASCISATSCEAVGWWYNAAGTRQTLAESWDGHSWTLQPAPNQGSADSFLLTPSCASATSCEAVGDYYNASGIEQTLAEFWNGRTWTIQPSPDPGTGLNNFQYLSCASASVCEVVGWYANGTGPGQSLIEGWDGRTWTVQPSPNEGTSWNVMGAISCPSTKSCVAVGEYINGAWQNESWSWNGHKWTVQLVPNVGTGSNYIDAVSCVSATSCGATGWYVNSSAVNQGFGESYH